MDTNEPSRTTAADAAEEGAAAAIGGEQETDCPYAADGDLPTRWRRHWWLEAFRKAGGTARH